MKKDITNWLILLITWLVLSACASDGEIIVTDDIPVENNSLAENIGIETLGGVFTPLLEKGCESPCQITYTFSTAEDNQSQIMINLFQGNSTMVSEAKHLGKFQVTGINPAPRGEPQIVISLKVESRRLVLRASEEGVEGELRWGRIE